MQHVDLRLQDATLGNLIHAAVERRGKSVGTLQRQLRKYSRVKQRGALAIWIDLHHRTKQRPVHRQLANVKISVSVTLRGTHERPTHLRSHVNSGGGVQRYARSSW